MARFPPWELPEPRLGSVVAFWFKAICYGTLLLRPTLKQRYHIASSLCFDSKLILKLLFYGFPTGLMFLTEASGFTVIMLRIGSIGDVPLRATTMAINFNMVAFIPLVGVSIAASVLVGRHLLQSGPARAAQSVYAALGVGAIYSGTWLIAYLVFPEWMMSLYQLQENATGFVAGYRHRAGIAEVRCCLCRARRDAIDSCRGVTRSRGYLVRAGCWNRCLRCWP